MQRLSDKDYFAYKGLSKSQIKKWNDQNPMWFWKNCLFNPNRIDEGVTDALVNGRLAHTLLLEPNKFHDEYKIIPDGKGFSSRKTKAFQDAIANEKSGKDLVLQSEFDNWYLRIKTLLSYDLVKTILSGISIEKPVIWEDRGLVLKAKLDAVKNTPQGIVLIEYKTTATIEKNIRGIDVGGYTYDVGMQCKAIESLYGQTPVKMVFIIQSSRPDEENWIEIRSVEQKDIEVCRVYTDLVIDKIKKRFDKGFTDDSFRTDLVEKGFEGYQESAFSLSFDRKLSEMGE
jgi:hypothetical protein